MQWCSWVAFHQSLPLDRVQITMMAPSVQVCAWWQSVQEGLMAEKAWQHILCRDKQHSSAGRNRTDQQECMKAAWEAVSGHPWNRFILIVAVARKIVVWRWLLLVGRSFLSWACFWAIIESSKSIGIGIYYGLSFLWNAESPRNLQQTKLCRCHNLGEPMRTLTTLTGNVWC